MSSINSRGLFRSRLRSEISGCRNVLETKRDLVKHLSLDFVCKVQL